MYLNFSQVGGPDVYVYFPVMLIGFSVAVLFNPLKIIYFRTRMWLLYSLVSIFTLAHALPADSTLVALVARWYLPC